MPVIFLPAELAKSFIPERQVRFTCGPSRTEAEHHQPGFGVIIDPLKRPIAGQGVVCLGKE